jgi:hypothetical protein
VQPRIYKDQDVKKSRIYRDPNITAENDIPSSETKALEMHPAVLAAISAG